MTAARLTFPTGLAQVGLDWTTGVYQWMLVTDAWTPNPTSEVYAAAAAAFELTDASYARQTMTTPATTITLPSTVTGPGLVGYGCDSPDFGIISGGEIAAALVLFAFVTNDSDSPLVASYPCAYTADGVTAATFSMASTGAVVVSTVCPGGF